MDDGQQLRARVAELEAALARMEGERNEARRQVGTLTEALAGAARRDPAAERELRRAERKRERDREYQSGKQAARVVRDRASSDDDGGGGNILIVDSSSLPDVVRDRASAISVEDLPSSSDVVRDRASEAAEHPELRRWWLWAQDRRRAAGAGAVEPFPKGTGPRSFTAWFAAVAEEVGTEALAEAFNRYVCDPDFSRRGWPVAIFRTPGVWRHRVPRELVDQHRAQFLEQHSGADEGPTPAQQEEKQP